MFEIKVLKHCRAQANVFKLTCAQQCDIMVAWRTSHRPLARLFNNTSRDPSSRLPRNTLDDIDMHILRSLRRATAAGPKGTDLYGLVLEMGGFPYLAKHKLKISDVLGKSSRLHSLGLATGSLKGGTFRINSDMLAIYPDPRPADTPK